MNFASLLNQGKIKPIKSSKEEIKEILSLSDRDIKMAEFAITQNWDWAFSIAYNAALQASRAYMYSKGFRPDSKNGHKNTFEFMKMALGKERKDLIGFFDRMRPKRNRAIYDTVGLVTETEVKELLIKAKKYISIIKNELRS